MSNTTYSYFWEALNRLFVQINFPNGYKFSSACYSWIAFFHDPSSDDFLHFYMLIVLPELYLPHHTRFGALDGRNSFIISERLSLMFCKAS